MSLSTSTMATWEPKGKSMPVPALMSSCELEAALGGRGDLLPGDGAIRARPRTVELAVGQHEILRGAASRRLGGDLLRLVLTLTAWPRACMPPRAARAAAEGADAVPDERRVALSDLDHLHRDLELVGDQLGVGRFMALLRERPSPSAGSRARRRPRRGLDTSSSSEAADLDVGGEPDAHEAPVGARRLLLLAEPS